MLLDAETEVAGVREVLADKLKLLHGQAALHQIVGLLAADGHKARNLLITADSERADCETSLPIHRNLRCQLLQHLGSLLQPIAGLANGNVQHEFADADFPHILGVLTVRHYERRP
ncbi:hypothetical protein Vafri_1508, partial [Volvox africanus]